MNVENGIVKEVGVFFVFFKFVILMLLDNYNIDRCCSSRKIGVNVSLEKGF